MKTSVWIVGLIVTAVVAVFAVFLFGHPKTETYHLPSQDIRVQVARTLPQQIQGLSGVQLEEFEADGMLFVYGEAKEQTFWMKDMQFNLDVIWIHDGTIVKISEHVPAPAEGEAPVRMHSSPFKADEVLEIPAGKADEYGLNVGISVKGLN